MIVFVFIYFSYTAIPTLCEYKGHTIHISRPFLEGIDCKFLWADAVRRWELDNVSSKYMSIRW